MMTMMTTDRTRRDFLKLTGIAAAAAAVPASALNAAQTLAAPDPVEGIWLPCDGCLMSRRDLPELFDVIGHTYGGSGDEYRLPYFFAWSEEDGRPAERIAHEEEIALRDAHKVKGGLSYVIKARTGDLDQAHPYECRNVPVGLILLTRVERLSGVGERISF